jgi:uncharacterized membrane protein YeiB
MAEDTPAPESSPAPAAAPFAPVAAHQRIEALDVVRGFALMGIFLMNIEFFNRVISSINEGMPRGLSGLDWLASWFIAYFVQGKFWTIFSLLFGMGFAVMLVRAERAGREFKRVYLRRILALAVFGAVHYIFLWEGDILFSYAVGALALLLVLYARLKFLWIACAVLAGLGFIPDFDPFFGIAGGLAAVGLIALYLRSERRLSFRGLSVPIFALILLLLGTLMSIAALVFWLLPDGPIEPRLPLSMFGPLVVLSGLLSWRYHQPADKRSVRLAVALYMFGAISMTAGGLVQFFAPDPAAPAPAASVTASAVPAQAAAASAAVTKVGAAASKAKKTKEERAAEVRAERDKRLAENKAEQAEELKVFTHGSYADTVDWRARRFLKKAAGDGVFAVVLVGMFLLGVWFVRSGVMENTGAHLAFFRKLALYALPLGIGIGLLSGFIAMSHTPGDRQDGWGIARGLATLGNLPACLGYVGLVVLMLHSKTVFARIRVLAPAGRMALTNYLTQSLVCVIWFYGFALGHWGMSRAVQVLFVLAVFAIQVAFSHWWLARVRYGPMEWVWRGFTYRQTPPWRIGGKAGAATVTA